MKCPHYRTACWHSRFKGIYLLLWCLIATTPIFSQTPPVTPLSASTTSEEREQSLKREGWLMRGRRMPGQPAAALRYRAYLHKLHLRAQRQSLQVRDGKPT